MQVKVKSIIAGPGGNAQPKDVIEVSDQFGKDLIAGGYAEAVADEQAIEEAVAPAPETAIIPRGRGRKR